MAATVSPAASFAGKAPLATGAGSEEGAVASDMAVFRCRDGLDGKYPAVRNGSGKQNARSRGVSKIADNAPMARKKAGSWLVQSVGLIKTR
jgi:hypothetical protein